MKPSIERRLEKLEKSQAKRENRIPLVVLRPGMLETLSGGVFADVSETIPVVQMEPGELESLLAR